MTDLLGLGICRARVLFSTRVSGTPIEPTHSVNPQDTGGVGMQGGGIESCVVGSPVDKSIPKPINGRGGRRRGDSAAHNHVFCARTQLKWALRKNSTAACVKALTGTWESLSLALRSSAAQATKRAEQSLTSQEVCKLSRYRATACWLSLLSHEQLELAT